MELTEQTYDLKGALIRLLKPHFKNKLAEPAEVISVEGTTITAKSIGTQTTHRNIRLQAAAGNGMYVVPAVGSVVLINWISDVYGYVAMYSDVDSIQFLDGSFGGLIKIEELVDKINTIEQDLNDLKTVFQTWVTTPGDGGAALKTTAATWYASTITKTQKADIENEDITHGIP